jgi:hypothetical protein
MNEDRLGVTGYGSVEKVGLKRGRPGRVEVVLSVDRGEGVIERLAELADKGLLVSVDLWSLQQKMGMAVNAQTGEIVAGFGERGPMP